MTLPGPALYKFRNSAGSGLDTALLSLALISFLKRQAAWKTSPDHLEKFSKKHWVFPICIVQSETARVPWKMSRVLIT